MKKDLPNIPGDKHNESDKDDPYEDWCVIPSVPQAENMDSPVPLVLVDGKSGKLYLNKQMARNLASVTKSLVIVSIVGKYRTGKSYLLNRLMGKQAGFPLGSTIESETKGIWVWLRPHPYVKNRMILLMDAEGLANPANADQTHDVSIFSLAILLSSLLIYNRKGTIDKRAIEELHFTSEMTEHIKVKARSYKIERDLGRIAPVFIWAVRDFTLDLKINDKEITPNEYLEYILRDSGSPSNNVKKSIRNLFRDRYCFTFPTPVDSDEKLKRLDTISEAELKPSFLNVVNNFSEFVFNLAPTTKIDGNDVNGRMFVNLLQNYLEAITNGAIPCIESDVNYMATVENLEAVEASVRMYDTEMSKLAYPVSEPELNKCNQEAEKQYEKERTRRLDSDKKREQAQLELKIQIQRQQEMEQNHKDAVQLFERNMDRQMRRIESEKENSERLLRDSFNKERIDLHRIINDLQGTVAQHQRKEAQMRSDFQTQLEKAAINPTPT